jgi:hypothetical protein
LRENSLHDVEHVLLYYRIDIGLHDYTTFLIGHPVEAKSPTESPTKSTAPLSRIRLERMPRLGEPTLHAPSRTAPIASIYN